MNNRESIDKDVAKEASLQYFNGDNLAADVFLKKYALKDKDGNLLEQIPSDMHKRLVDEFYRIESRYDNPVDKEYLNSLFDHFKYIVPQGSPMF
ncbi:MAG: ribonucleoside-diphosphate reductase, adenosylcobalamin-dependent, partial [Nanoarchaeota archaeon]|nr:ribonucleoside-diphosphate reductase, adenosylcobalamin-dependent [Nanoarchaeota archaeon]